MKVKDLRKIGIGAVVALSGQKHRGVVLKRADQHETQNHVRVYVPRVGNYWASAKDVIAVVEPAPKL